MTEYEDDFERDEENENIHLLKLSLDVLSVKDMVTSANMVVSYTLKLK